MTLRLYHSDSTLRDFTARIVARRDTERGPAVRLDRTAFYPTAGGQPHDTGTLNDVRVRDVWDEDDGAVWHLLERGVDGDAVTGAIDWERRFDHMQQHTGQHLLSAGFGRLREAPTVSFHLGTDESTSDLDVAELSWDDVFRVEAWVNQVIWDDRPVEIHAVDEDDIHQVPLRKAPKVTGTIRVVWIRDVDASACGGTHVPRTGVVGVVKVVRLERYKGGMRVGFVCGGRALVHHQRTLRALQTASADLSVHPDQLAEAVVRLQGDAKDARRELKAAREALAVVEAERLWDAAVESDGVRRVMAYVEDLPAEQVGGIASRLAQRSRAVVLLAANDPKGLRLTCARSADLPDVDASAMLRAVTERLGGRGGGTAAHAQGGAPAAGRAEVLAALAEATDTVGG
ncbi:MAG: DHHA1 domain-containing protein [Gemmatimonadota bacterium]|nr:DHHA1 domain-containing protein [Gemmatimonadota bacterium]